MGGSARVMSAILALAALSTLLLWQASGAFGDHAAIAAPPAPAPNALALPPKTVGDDSAKPVMTALSRESVFQAGDCDMDGKCFVGKTLLSRCCAHY
eukprot:SAG31_NODE_6288_length_2082_cov_47.039334_3_plen_97_part_00